MIRLGVSDLGRGKSGTAQQLELRSAAPWAGPLTPPLSWTPP